MRDDIPARRHRCDRPRLPLAELTRLGHVLMRGIARLGLDADYLRARYGDYLLAKIAKVFPELQRRVLRGRTPASGAGTSS